MKVNNFIQVFDMNDSSEKKLYLKGVLVAITEMIYFQNGMLHRKFKLQILRNIFVRD